MDPVVLAVETSPIESLLLELLPVFIIAAGVGISLMVRRLTVGRSGVASTQPDGPLEEDARSGERE